MKKSVKIALASTLAGVGLWIGAGIYSNDKATYYTNHIENGNFMVERFEEGKKDHTKEIERYKRTMCLYQKQAKLAEEKGDEEAFTQYVKEAKKYKLKYENGKETFPGWDNLITKTKEGYKYFEEKSEKWKKIADIMNPF